MKEQSQMLASAVSIFKLAGDELKKRAAPRPAPMAAPKPPAPKPAARVAAAKPAAPKKLAASAAASGDDWEEF
jgi:methyl-accepting chemotaxis protein